MERPDVQIGQMAAKGNKIFSVKVTIGPDSAQPITGGTANVRTVPTL